jgi:Tol biopolymer transport system component
VVPALGGTPKRLVGDGESPLQRRQPTEGTHAWSPDGKSMALTRVTGLWVRTLSDGKERQVVAGAFVHSPAWSPDGRLLAYAEGRRPTLNNISTNVVWVVPASGGEPIRISDSTRTNASPAWAADGHSVLFVSSVGGIRDIYQQPVRADGRPSGERVRLTTGLSPFTISLSADGTRMAYDVVRNFSNVWSAPVPTSGSVSLAQATPVTRENQHVESMDVSRDGKWLAYDSDRAGNFDIYKLRLDGGEPIQLTTAPSNEFHPVWSPDGQSIAFHSQRSGFRHIYVMNADGNGEAQITRGQTQDYCRSWSLDGRSISFASGRNVGNRGYIAMYATKEAGGAWATPKPFAADTDAIGVGYGMWSPDGKTAAYTANGNVMMIPAARGTPTVFATQAALGGPAIGLAWPQSGMLFVSVGGSETFRISKIVGLTVPGGAQKSVLMSDAAHHFGREEFSTDGRRLFFTMAAYESDVGVMELTKRK